MFAPPKTSPWGEVDYCDALCPGVFQVSATGHGGTMIVKEIEEFLSPAARKCGQKHNGYLCFEEDCNEAVVFRELLDKKLWEIPDRIRDKAAFEESINRALRLWNPNYWRSRERGRVHASPSNPAPAHAER